MANKKELEELGKKFIDLEIEVLNKTNTSIFENGIYNKEYLKIPEWEKGIKEFLAFDNYADKNIATREFYQGLIELVNKAYIRYQDCLSNVDRLNLKVYLQMSEILEQEQKIVDLERYQSSEEVIRSLEYLNNLVLSSYTSRLKAIQGVINNDKLKEAMKVVTTSKNQEEMEKHFTKGQLKDFEFLYNLTKPGNEDKLEAEIKEAQHSIDEAKRRQKGYEKEKKDKVKLEELKKDKKAISNFFGNKEAVESTIKVLNTCLDYYYNLIFLNQFMSSLSVLEIQREFYFIKPLELMSYSKLEMGLGDIINLLEYKNIKSTEFKNTAYKYIYLSLFSKEEVYTSSKEIKEAQRVCRKMIFDVRQKLCKSLELKNRRNAVSDIIELEKDFIKALKEEKGW